MAKEFGEILKKLRSERDLTQSEMAEATDLSLRFYQSLENDGSEPGLESIKKIIDGLKIDPLEIFGMPSRVEPTPTIKGLIRSLNGANEALTEMQKENETCLKSLGQMQKELTEARLLAGPALLEHTNFQAEWVELGFQWKGLTETERRDFLTMMSGLNKKRDVLEFKQNTGKEKNKPSKK